MDVPLPHRMDGSLLEHAVTNTGVRARIFSEPTGTIESLPETSAQSPTSKEHYFIHR